jgi:hypothetical protein
LQQTNLFARLAVFQDVVTFMTVKVKVKLSRYRSGETLGVPGG